MPDSYIIGVDEVGRGPIAGPVAVCAFKLRIKDYELIIGNAKKELKIPLRDSKKLTKKQREKWFEYLKVQKEKGNCDFAISMVSAEWIDKVGIVRAIQKSLNQSLSKLEVDKSSIILLDGGLKAPVEYTRQQTIIKGDELHPVISCASIMAKVTRDTLMAKYAKEYPDYGFENHMGYGTKAHYEAIKKSGLTPLHRRTFLKNFV